MQLRENSHSGIIFVLVKLFFVAVGIVMCIYYKNVLCPNIDSAYFIIGYWVSEMLFSVVFTILFWIFGRFKSKTVLKTVLSTVLFVLLDIALIVVISETVGMPT